MILFFAFYGHSDEDNIFFLGGGTNDYKLLQGRYLLNILHRAAKTGKTNISFSYMCGDLEATIMKLQEALHIF